MCRFCFPGTGFTVVNSARTRTGFTVVNSTCTGTGLENGGLFYIYAFVICKLEKRQLHIWICENTADTNPSRCLSYW